MHMQQFPENNRISSVHADIMCKFKLNDIQPCFLYLTYATIVHSYKDMVLLYIYMYTYITYTTRT